MGAGSLAGARRPRVGVVKLWRSENLVRLLPILALAVACTPVEVDKDEGGTLGVDTGEAGCEGTPPDITGMTVGEGNVIEDENGNPQPSVRISVEFEDVDGDAHAISMDLWWDETVDGSVDTSGAANASLPSTALTNDGEPVDECEGFGGTLNVDMGVTGSDLQFSTQYDFAAVVIDANGYASAPGIASGTTPAPLEE